MNCADCHKELKETGGEVVVWTTINETGIVVWRATLLCSDCRERVETKRNKHRTVVEFFCEIPAGLSASAVKQGVEEEIERSRLEGLCWTSPALRNLVDRGVLGAFRHLVGWSPKLDEPLPPISSLLGEVA